MIGETVSHYTIVEKLGEGGMGEVYKAKDNRLERIVALKFLPEKVTDDPESKARFLREAQTASKLDHPNICTVYEIDETDDGKTFIAMSHCPGIALKEKLKEKSLSTEEAVGIAVQIGEGLEEAHRQGIVHRDIKPGNIMISEQNKIKIVDFGLAKLRDSLHITKPGKAMGTAAYMSPEQLRGEDVDSRTDIWALGVVLYQMLSGKLPFEGEYEAAVIYSILNKEAPKLPGANEGIAAGLQRVLVCALQKDPNDRYPTTTEFLADLKSIQSEIGTPTEEISAGWATEKTGVKRVSPLVVFSATVAVIIFSLIVAVLLIAPGIQQWLGGPGLPPKKHLAILPFSLIGGESEDRAMCDGLVETLSSKITSFGQFQKTIWIVPTREIIEENIASPSQARGTFGVSLVVTGSVQRMGDSAQLTLNLIDASSLRQVRSAQLIEPIANIHVLQSKAVGKLVEMLEFEVPPQSRDDAFAGGTETSDAFKYYLQGRGFLQHYQDVANIDRAMEFFNKAISSDPDYALAFAGLGEACYRKFQATRNSSWVETGTDYCARALALDDSLEQVHNTAGFLLMASGQYEPAAAEFRKALEINPVNAETFKGLGRAHEHMGEIDEAERIYSEAIQLRPDYWSGYNELGGFYLSLGRYDEAEAQFRKILELTPGNVKGYNNLGIVYFNAGRYDEAEKIFLRSIEIKPNYRAFNNLGVLYHYQKRYADAARTMEKALDLEDQSDFLTWGNLGDAYFIVPEEHEKAIGFYKKAISLAEAERRINPRNSTLLAYLAEYYIKVGEPDSAANLLGQLDLPEVQDLEVLYSVAESYLLLGDRNRAISFLERVLREGFPSERVRENPAMKELLQDDRIKVLIGSVQEP